MANGGAAAIMKRRLIMLRWSLPCRDSAFSGEASSTGNVYFGDPQDDPRHPAGDSGRDDGSQTFPGGRACDNADTAVPAPSIPVLRIGLARTSCRSVALA